MTTLVSPQHIERIVGARRHDFRHIARADSAKEQVYILHSYECLRTGVDLRECRFSVALDDGIDLGAWEDEQDLAVFVTIEHDRLLPAGAVHVNSENARPDGTYYCRCSCGAAIVQFVRGQGEPWHEAHVAGKVPGQEPWGLEHVWPSNTNVNRPASLDRCSRCGVRRFSDEPDTAALAAGSCPGESA